MPILHYVVVPMHRFPQRSSCQHTNLDYKIFQEERAWNQVSKEVRVCSMVVMDGGGICFCLPETKTWVSSANWTRRRYVLGLSRKEMSWTIYFEPCADQTFWWSHSRFEVFNPHRLSPETGYQRSRRTHQFAKRQGPCRVHFFAEHPVETIQKFEYKNKSVRNKFGLAFLAPLWTSIHSGFLLIPHIINEKNSLNPSYDGSAI